MSARCGASWASVAIRWSVVETVVGRGVPGILPSTGAGGLGPPALHRVAWGRFPCGLGTMRASDVSRSLPRCALALAARYLRWMLGCAPQAGASITALGPGPWSPVAPPGI